MIRTERRQRRSDDPNLALGHQLEACRRKAGLDALFLTDGDGLCIASSGPADTCEEFAARVSLMCREARAFDGELWTEDARWIVHVRRFDVDGSELCLCAVGGLPDARELEVERSLRGVRRILAA
jgi:hypothetical protein